MIPGQVHSSVYGASAAHPTLHIDYLRSLPEEEGAAILDAMTPEELQWFSYDFYGCWAHPYQHPPDGSWSTWVLCGGRGSGKSRAGAEWIKERVKQGARTIALVARTKRDVREVMVKALLSDQLYPDAERPIYNPSLSKLTWPNGAIAYLYSADEPDQLRGPQHDTCWADELAAWRRPDAWDQLQFGMRVPTPVTAYGEAQGLSGYLQPQTIATTTPKRVEFFRNVLKSHGVVLTGGSTYANRANLSEHFIQHIKTQYGGTRLGQQEIHGVMLDDNPDALWQYTTIDKYRVDIPGRPFVRDSLIRIVIGVDPEAASGEDSAETGIIVAGRTRSRHLYVLEDCTVHGTPDQWGRAVVEAYKRWDADLIVGEVNNGGDMVGHVILTADPRANFKPVRASRGKVIRAEPVSAIYEQGKGHHVGYLPELESQLTSWMPGEKSPDRMDALVWAATELLITDGMYNGRGAVSAPRLQAPVRLQLPPGGRF
jgi:phage terminase large subunit-like protein